ncbi:helix-turn-helix domain-containing protein [Subdoligranulum variabile]|uniref:helix-turn-helix domain-containing protein n=1 Tax=Subdoligranulum variabile TaxID=214851 RepID=UPI00350E5095
MARSNTDSRRLGGAAVLYEGRDYLWQRPPYLTTIRIEKSKEFLADPSLMIYTVSEMVGYENPRYFSRLFKEALGCSPQEYRNQLP